MDAVGCDQEYKENDLEARECYVCCDEESGGWAGREDRLHEICNKRRHLVLIISRKFVCGAACGGLDKK